MKNWEEKRQLVKISNWYYNDNLTQEQIAKKLSVSRPIISKFLQKAKDLGIVEVYINDETVHTVNMENILEERFALRDVVVAPVPGSTGTNALHAVGRAGAYYLSKNIKHVGRLGISWGETLTALVEAYPYELRKQLKVVPLEGGMGRKKVEIHANQLAYELAKKVGGSCSYLYAPAVVETEELKNRLLQMEDIKAVLEEGENVDVALIGIGNPFEHSTLEEIGYLQTEEIQELNRKGISGDMGFRFFDQNGQPVVGPFDKKVIGLTLDDLKMIDVVIAVVAGVHKMESVLAALKGGYIDVLVIDEKMASALVERTQST